MGTMFLALDKKPDTTQGLCNLVKLSSMVYGICSVQRKAERSVAHLGHIALKTWINLATFLN